MIKIENIKLKLGERVLKFKDNCIFPMGTMTYIKGESGAGKTTFLYILGMLSKQNDYDYYFNDCLINDQDDKEYIRKNEIGMLYQNFNMLEELSLYQNMKLFADINSVEFDKDKAIKVLQLVNLTMDLDRLFSSLSGGEKQRFCLACIILKNPSVIIADEPTSALDQTNAKQLMGILYKLAKEYNKIVIVSTHSKEFDNLADNIITLTRNEVSQTNESNETNKKVNLLFKKLNPSFYFDMTKFRLRRMLKNSGIVLSLMIVMLSLSAFLLNYSTSSKEEYSYYLSNSLESEVFAIPKDESSRLEEEHIEKIKMIPTVENVYPVFRLFGQLTFEGNNLGMMEIYPVYSFQRGFNEDACAVSSMLYDCLGKDIQLNVAGKNIELPVEMVYSMDKTNMYSIEKIGKVFVPYEYIQEFANNDYNKYVIEIKSFFEFNNISQKINAINDGYRLQSSYQFFSNLLRNANQQQIFINIGSTILMLISAILFITVQIHEVKDKRKEMCIFQANGLNKKHVFTLEIIENCFKFIVFFTISIVISIILVLLANQFILSDIIMHIDLRYILVLLGLLVFTIIIPGLVAAFYMIKQSPEDELRALF